MPHFTGRQSECEEVVHYMTSQSTRLVTISGPPGFGKTSVAIAVAHRLKNQGLPVYFFSLRNVKTTNGLASKLLNCFTHTSSYPQTKQPCPPSGVVDKLCQILSEISPNFFIVLDNADDILESGGMDARQEVSDLLQEIFMHCKSVTFLCTTRMNLEFLEHKFEVHKSIKIGPLDKSSSNQLVRQLLPEVNDDNCETITQVCGCVPLAVKLLCALIADDDEYEVLNEIRSVSLSILDLLDNPDSTNDLQLKILFESSFKRLSQKEKEGFVSLSVFRGEKFDMDAAVNVVGGNKQLAKQTLQRLQRKCLLDFSSEGKFFSFHPLLSAFAVEKGKNEMKEISLQAHWRFLYYYVLMFKNLNNQFLDGNSLSAFVKFHQEKENIFLSLREGVYDDTVCNEIFEFLPTAELFLDTITCFEEGSFFDDIYDSALQKARDRRKTVITHQLLVGKAFAEIACGKGGITPKLLKEAEEIELEHPSVIPDGAKGKRLCYLGIHLLLDGGECKGSQMLESGASLLSNINENRILKFLNFHILALYDEFARVQEKSSKFNQLAFKEYQKKTVLNPWFFSRNQPLILAVIWLISQFPKTSFVNNTLGRLGALVLQMHEEMETKSKNNPKFLPLLRYIDQTLIMLNKNEDAHYFLQRTLDITVKKYGEQHAETADTYSAIADSQRNMEDYSGALQSNQKALKICLKVYGKQNARTANSYHWIGITQHEMEDYVSALQSKQEALNIRLKLYGKQHEATADSYDEIGETQHEMEDYISALDSKLQALKIRSELFGEQHAATADSYHSVGVTQHAMEDFVSALQSKRQARKIRLKLFGEQHEATAESYDEIGETQHEMEDYISALDSKLQALKIRSELFGEQHAATADSYHSVGVTQHAMEDFVSALQSKRQARKIRLKLFGEQHEATAESYDEIGKTEHEMEDYVSALRSKQQALNIRLKLLGEHHEATAESYCEIGVTHFEMKDNVSALQSLQQALISISKTCGEQQPATASIYAGIGIIQNEMKDCVSALQSHQQALDIWLKLYGEEHAVTALSYHWIGATQHKMGDYASALQSHQQALNIWLKLYGEEHAVTALSYHWIGATQHKMGDYASALQSHQQALDIRLKLYGEEHAATADSYDSIGITQREMKDYISAFKSKQLALKIRSKLYGEKNPATSDSYRSIMATQHEREDHVSDF